MKEPGYIEASKPVVRAIRTGDMRRVKRALTKWKKLPQKSKQGHSGFAVDSTLCPYRESIGLQRYDFIQALIKAGVPTDTTTFWYQTPLGFAVEKDDLRAATMLIEAGANVNEEGDLGITPLMEAIDNNSLPMVQLLHSKGAALSWNKQIRSCPLLFAVETLQFEIAEYFIRNGYSLSTNVYSDGNSFVHQLFCNTDVYTEVDFYKALKQIEFLTRYGASFDIKNRCGKTAMDCLMNGGKYEIAAAVYIRILQKTVVLVSVASISRIASRAPIRRLPLDVLRRMSRFLFKI